MPPQPERDAALAAQATECSVRQLAELAKNELGARRKPTAPPPPASTRTRSVRFNDACRTMTAQLPAESYAEVRARLEARARQFPSDGGDP